MIAIKNLSKSFKDKLVLDDVNLIIKTGEIMGLVGINGSGKSTLLRLISGIYAPNKGEVLFDEENVLDSANVKQQLFLLPDEPYYSINTTPLSLIKLYENFYSFNKNEYLTRLKKLNLPLNKSLKSFSKGMKRQVFVSLSFSIKPKYLFLDEAFDGLDPLARLTLKKELKEMSEKNGTTVIISSHSLRELEDVCDRYALIDNKKITTTGVIEGGVKTFHKYQLAFKKEMEKEDFTFEYKSMKITKRVVEVIAEYSYEQFTEIVKPYKPLIVDEIPIDFEESFLIEVEGKGYVE